MHSLQSNAWQTKHTYSKMECLWSYPWQEQHHSMHGSIATSSEKSLNMSTICQDSLYSKSRSSLSHAIALHNCKQWQEWINNKNIYKTFLLNISKICMDRSVASSLHGNKITTDQGLSEIAKFLKWETLRSLLCMLVLVTIEITKIHGLYQWEYGMAYFKTHVELMPKRCTD